MADGIQHAGDTSKIWEEGSGVFLPTIRSVLATFPNIRAEERMYFWKFGFE
jgi:hypothetical protein